MNRNTTIIYFKNCGFNSEIQSSPDGELQKNLAGA
jgi:hypothetical protein